jgi:hypothetical protein
MFLSFDVGFNTIVVDIERFKKLIWSSSSTFVGKLDMFFLVEKIKWFDELEAWLKHFGIEIIMLLFWWEISLVVGIGIYLVVLKITHKFCIVVFEAHNMSFDYLVGLLQGA